MHPRLIRYFAVGEYGDRTARPHYHLAVFGLPRCGLGLTINAGNDGPQCCALCRDVFRIWGHGRVQLGNLEPASAAYLAGYVTKKMTRPGDPRLDGRYPEFTRMSLKPAIGSNAIKCVALALTESQRDTDDDVPAALRVGGFIRPFGRTLRNRLRRSLDRYEGAPPSTLKALQEGMQNVREIAFPHSLSITEVLNAISQGDYLNLLSQLKLRTRSL